MCRRCISGWAVGGLGEAGDVNGVEGFGHGGFWGTAVNYFPEINASISIFVLDRDKRALRIDLNEYITAISIFLKK